MTDFVEVKSDGLHIHGAVQVQDEDGTTSIVPSVNEVHISSTDITFVDELGNEAMNIGSHLLTADNIQVNEKMNVGILSERVMSNGSVSEMWEVGL